MAEDASSLSFEGLSEDENRDVEALERLEARVLDMVEQLRQTRANQMTAEREAARLREDLEEKERQIERLESERDEGHNNRQAVRSRIETLLDRIEGLEHDQAEQ